MSKKKYFYIEQYVYSNFVNNNILLYNTFTNKFIDVFITNKELLNFIERVLLKDNLRTIDVSQEELKNVIIAKFINKCRDLFIADIIESDSKPFIMSPIPKLNQNIRESIKGNSEHVLNAKNMIKELNYFIDSKKTLCTNIKLKANGYKQILFPFYNAEIDKQLEFLTIEKFLFDMNIQNIEKINIIGNICSENYNNEILVFFKNNFIQFHTYYLDFDLNGTFATEILKTKNKSFVFWIDNIIVEDQILKLNEFVIKNNIYSIFKFIVTNEHEVNQVIEFTNTITLNYELIPFFNQTNIDFFENNIFNTKKDILNQKLNEREIFSKMYINILNYGKLYFLPNGAIYSNLNINPIGNIINDELSYTLKNEVLNDNAWFKTRDTILPCKNCIYQFICPPTTNYEKFINKNNLCHYNPYIAKWQGEEGYVPVEKCGTYTKEKGFVVNKRKVNTLNKQIWGEE